MPQAITVPGVFAIGDVRAHSVKRIAAAAGEGSMAVRLAQQYLGRVAPDQKPRHP